MPYLLKLVSTNRLLPRLIRTTRAYTPVLFQKRFFLDSSATDDLKWDIPISYTISHSVDFNTTSPSLWFPSTEDNVTISNILHGGTGWVVLNIQETGMMVGNR